MDLTLPKHVVPMHYSIHLVPKNKEVFCKVEILVEVLKKENFIVLNSVDLYYESIKVMNEKNEDVKLMGYELNELKQLLTLNFESSLETGKYNVIFDYRFDVSQSDRGFYHCSFGDVKGYATHLEPSDARTIFPCFDEPAIRATFKLSVTAPPEFHVISNTLIESIDKDTNTFTFEKTPNMSTYLLAVIIGKFDILETKSNNVIIRANVPLGMKEQASYSLGMAKRCLEYYSEKFECEYILSKLDLVSVDQIDAYAEENFGCITFRKEMFVVNESTQISRKQRISRLVFHEVGHQWFGNLVGIKWWNYVWVKEGFARFLEYELISDFFPDWNYWSHFLVEIYRNAMKGDGPNTHAVEVPIDHPGKIKDVFDIISYGKGASVLRMMFGFIGKDLMWKSLAHFINTHKYQNTTTEDLYKSISIVTKIDVESFMDPWIKEGGYPILICENDELKFNETRKIPLLINNQGKIQSVLLDKSPYVLEKGVKVNYNHTSYIRIRYSKDMIEKLKYLPLTQEDLIGLFMDSIYFFKLPHDHELNQSFEEFISILDIIVNSKVDYIPEFQKYMKEEVLEIFHLSKEYSYHGHLSKALSKIFENSNMTYVKEIFKKVDIELNLNNLSHDHIRTVLSLERKKDFETLLTFYHDSNDPDLKFVILSSLWNVTNEEDLKKVLEIYYNEKDYEKHLEHIIDSLTSNPKLKYVISDHITSDESKNPLALNILFYSLISSVVSGNDFLDHIKLFRMTFNRNKKIDKWMSKSINNIHFYSLLENQFKMK